jgi:ribosomal protein L7/L12
MSFMSDDTLVSQQALRAAIDHMGEHGSDAVLQALQQAEPCLSYYLTESAARVVGKLALSGAPHEVVTGVHGDLLWTCALVYLAVRRGSYEIWQDTALGERLRVLDPAAVSEPAGDTAASLEEEVAAAAALEPHAVVLLGVRTGRKTELAGAVRRLTGWTLRQVRELLEHTPVTLFEDVRADVAATIQAELEHSGGRTLVTPPPPAAACSDGN